MTNSIRAALIIGVLALGLGITGSGVATAGPLQDAMAAHDGGDYATALRIFRELADQGDADAQVYLGVMYINGRGMETDEKGAAEWFRRAAEKGHADAQYNLGDLYAAGRGVEKDEKEAVKWYRLSAEQGTASAQNNLAVMYAKGRGVAQDYVHGYMWLILAAQIDAEAEENRDAVAALMTPVQIAQSEEMATRCKAANYKSCD